MNNVVFIYVLHNILKNDLFLSNKIENKTLYINICSLTKKEKPFFFYFLNIYTY